MKLDHHSVARFLTAMALASTLCQPAAAGFFGPSNKLLTGEALTEKLASAPIFFSVNANVLDIRTKGAAVGSFLLGFVVSSALASGGGGMPSSNPQQMQQSLQAQMDISKAFNQNLQVAMTKIASDQSNKPKGQIAKEGPAVLVSQQLLASLLQAPKLKLVSPAAGQAAAATDLQMRVTQTEWKLDFSMASSNYTLLYQTEVVVYQKDSDTNYFSYTCKGESPQKIPLEAWERDDFSEVAQAATVIGNKCLCTISRKSYFSRIFMCRYFFNKFISIGIINHYFFRTSHFNNNIEYYFLGKGFMF